MPTVLHTPQSPAEPSRDQSTDRDHRTDSAIRHAELDGAARRWLREGESPENVAAYAHALRTLIGDL